MRRLAITTLAVLLLVGMTAGTALAQEKPAATQSLYSRLGGYDAIAAVTDDFVGRLASDPQLGRYFVGFSEDSKKTMRQRIVDFLCQTTGGPCVYTGRDMKTVHTGLKITEQDWETSVKHLNATFDKFKVPQKERGEVLQAISGLKPDIVGR